MTYFVCWPFYTGFNVGLRLVKGSDRDLLLQQFYPCTPRTDHGLLGHLDHSLLL